MRLNKEQQYGYNRYLDYLHVKASEALSLQIEVQEKIRKDENFKKAVEIAMSLLQTSLKSEDIAKHTKLTIEQIEQMRNEKG